MLESPYARCRHPRGDRWRGEDITPQVSNEPTQLTAHERIVVARLDTCTQCNHYRGAHRCELVGAIMPRADRAAATCPAERWQS